MSKQSFLPAGNNAVPLLALGLALAVCASSLAYAAEPASTNATNAAKPVLTAEAAYAKTLEKRSGEILKALALTNQASAAKVHDLVVAHYRALREWHDKNDGALKNVSAERAAPFLGSLRLLHDQFLQDLSSVLSPAQIEVVKDRMTYNKVKVTYDGYCRNVPKMTEAQKQKVLAFLKDAREEAMDAGSSEDKSKIFRKYKGRINNYLVSQGYDSKQADKEAAGAPQVKTATPGAAPEE